RCRSHDFQLATLGGSAGLKIDASNKFLIAGRELLPDRQLVHLESGSLFVKVGGFYLDLIVGELIAVIAQSNDPGGPCSGCFRRKPAPGKKNSAERLRAFKKAGKSAPVLSTAGTAINTESLGRRGTVHLRGRRQ